MYLQGLPVDVLSLIVRFLDFPEVLTLVFTGCPPLRQRLWSHGTVRNIALTTRFRRFSPLDLFRSLEDLSLHLHHSVKLPYTFWQHLPPRLGSLSFHHSNLSSFLIPPASSASDDLSVVHLDSVVPSLRHFHFKVSAWGHCRANRKRYRFGKLLRLAFFAHLPASLLSLQFSMDEGFDYVVLNYIPSSLTKLSVDLQLPAVHPTSVPIKPLPFHLTSISISTFPGPNNKLNEWTKDMLGGTYPALTALRLEEPISISPLFEAPSLTLLEANLLQLRNLPKCPCSDDLHTLKLLSAGTLEKTDVAALPTSLSALHLMGSFDDEPPMSNLPPLPSHIVDLRITNLLVSDDMLLRALPQALQKLAFSSAFFNRMNLLPATLTDLTITSMRTLQTEQCSMLPSSLTKLSLPQTQILEQLLLQLPSTLSSVVFERITLNESHLEPHMTGMDEKSCVNAFFRYCKRTFKFEVQSTHVLVNVLPIPPSVTNLHVDWRWGASGPRVTLAATNLKHLRIDNEPTFARLGGWPTLSRLPLLSVWIQGFIFLPLLDGLPSTLTSLTLPSVRINAATLAPLSSLLSARVRGVMLSGEDNRLQLPKSLTCFEVDFNEFHLPHFKQLPRTLKTLALGTPKNLPFNKFDFLPLLPENLTRLDLMQHSAMNTDHIRQLPSTLTSLFVPSIFVTKNDFVAVFGDQALDLLKTGNFPRRTTESQQTLIQYLSKEESMPNLKRWPTLTIPASFK